MISLKEVSVPEFFNNYLNKAGDDHLLKALTASTKRLKKCLKSISAKKSGHAYAEGKWTVKELIQHMIDTERVFVFRALWFSRKDPNPQFGFDENYWAQNAPVSQKSWEDLCAEFFALRKSTELFFQGLTNDQLQSVGIASNNPISVAALGFITAGHCNHHIDIIEERYFPKKKSKKAKK